MKNGKSCTITLCARWDVDMLITVQGLSNGSGNFIYTIYSGKSWSEQDSNYDITNVIIGGTYNGTYSQHKYSSSGNNKCSTESLLYVGPGSYYFGCEATINQNDYVYLCVTLANGTEAEFGIEPSTQMSTKRSVYGNNINIFERNNCPNVKK